MPVQEALEATNEVWSILVADDNRTDRLILQAILTREGHRVFCAEDGVEALQIFERESVDMVLLDALMPNMDGYEAARRIKAMLVDRFVPVIFLTSLTEAPALAGCLEAGGDDFLTKPYNKVILQAKLKAFGRVRQLYQTIHQQKAELSYHHERLLHEQDVAKKVFDNIAPNGCLSIPSLRQLLSPLAMFNGDLVMAAYKPSGGIHLMIGDFTGHGLPAAIGGLPASEIFYGMTRKGFSYRDILVEINQRLKSILPTGLFCCAIFMDIDPWSGIVSIWNGGLPEALFYRPGVGVIANVRSRHLPLGILSPERFSTQVDIQEFVLGDQIYLYSDGIIEASNQQGEMFGAERLLQVFAQDTGRPMFDQILEQLAQFRGGENQQDDLTLVELTLSADLMNADDVIEPQRGFYGPMDWSMEYELRAESLRQFDPLPLMLHVLLETPGLKPHRAALYTVVAELFSNAFEHGVMQLDSSLKSSSKGFSEYYLLRQQRMQELTEGYIKICFAHHPTNEGGRLLIRFEDSGPGFDYRAQSTELVALSSYCGRGLPLLKSLSTDVRHLGRGNIVEVLFDWQRDSLES